MTGYNELIFTAGRENNSKRSFLLVNRYQAKHIPSDPYKTFELFDALAEKLKKSVGERKALIIGFAETATALGARLAVKMNCGYIQTTREDIPGVGYLDFSEEHSHASAQRIVKDDMDALMSGGETRPDIIIFADDEITTGRTIVNIVSLMRSEYGDGMKKTELAAASLINGMTSEQKELYRESGISLCYLYEREGGDPGERLKNTVFDGEYIPPDTNEPDTEPRRVLVGGYISPRRLVSAGMYEKSCGSVCGTIISELLPKLYGEILCLGTEELMYPAIMLARKLKERGLSAVSHSTTRSPIAVSREKGYVFDRRYELKSLYEEERRTFVYALKKYDCVIIVTDAANIPKPPLNTLLNALISAGNENIILCGLKIGNYHSEV